MRKVLVLLICVLCGCVSSETTENPQKLGVDFYNLNKNLHFDLLFEITTSESRYENYEPIDIGVYCLGVKGDYITIPTKGLSTRDLYKSDYFYDCKNHGKTDNIFYESYITSFKKEFNSITVPNYYNYKKPKVYGNPRLGKFIEFELSQKCRVYYLEDATTLIPYWKDKFGKMKKFDKKWYYEYK